MILRSAKTFAFGYILGVFLGVAVKTLLPGLYLYLLYLLEKKVTTQSAIAGGYSMGVFLNNLLASLMCSYGGYFTTRIFLKLKTPGSPGVRKLSFLEGRVKSLQNEELKYFLSLHTLPVFILGFNGLVLGFLLILYASQLPEYLGGILPHGFFELPAIILAGSIGYFIAEAIFASPEDFKKELNVRALKEVPRYAMVLLLLAAGAYLEP
jgi:uncharacterized membrane protein SpoIIM required for sporulation